MNPDMEDIALMEGLGGGEHHQDPQLRKVGTLQDVIVVGDPAGIEVVGPPQV